MRYRNLTKDLKRISGLLRGIPATQNNTNLHHLKVQSYIFFAHAAFEQYLESLALAVLEKSVSNFNTKQQINACIFGLVVFETIAQLDDEIPRKQIRSEVVRKLGDFVNIAKKNHEGIITANNGIKLKDQKALFLPVGLDPEEIDSVTAVSLDAFGTKRGGVAHRLKAQTQETKSSVLTETQTLLNGIVNFDREACKIVRGKMVV